jgi:hypothetical protein
MALEKSVVSPQGFDALQAYHRVENIGFLQKTSMTFNVVSYKNKTSTTEFARSHVSMQYDVNGANPIKQAYEHLKTLPEFAGATDC